MKSFIGYDNKIELKALGAYEIYFLQEMPKGLRGGEGNIILSFLENKMLSFTWNAPPQFPKVRNHKHKTFVVLEFKTISKNETQLTLNHLGWINDKEEWIKVFEYFQNAWQTVFKWLEESLH